MSVGNSIQNHRKRLNLSQEELAKKLLISRQTVSQWENGQTMPTVDNLLRLKEIFGISLDELVGGEPMESDGIKESISISYTKKELSEAAKLFTENLLFRIIITAVIVASVLLFMYLMTEDVELLMSGAVLILPMFLAIEIQDIKTYLINLKEWATKSEKIITCKYKYDVYDEFIKISTVRNGETVEMVKSELSEIKVWDIGSYMMLLCGDMHYFVKKDKLQEKSLLLSELKSKIVETYSHKDKWYVVALVLFILSVFSFFGPMKIVEAVSENGMAEPKNMWVFFLFMPIPISSIILGLYLGNRGYKTKKNIIAGIIMTVILFLFGMLYITANNEPSMRAYFICA